jgi:hypothetical protein
VCGAWWTSDICYDGTPNGYAVYEVNGSDLKWFYKATGKPPDQQMSVYAHGANSRFPDDIVANVWDVDKKWQVFWYEDGVKKGEMTLRRSLDPTSEKLYTGPDLPQKHKWVDPVNSDHIYFAPASKEAQTIVVEAINRWGTVYSTKL